MLHTPTPSVSTQPVYVARGCVHPQFTLSHANVTETPAKSVNRCTCFELPAIVTPYARSRLRHLPPAQAIYRCIYRRGRGVALGQFELAAETSSCRPELRTGDWLSPLSTVAAPLSTRCFQNISALQVARVNTRGKQAHGLLRNFFNFWSNCWLS